MTPGSTKRKRRARSVRRATPALRRADQARIAAERELVYVSPVAEHRSGVTGKTTTVAHNVKAQRPARGSKQELGNVTASTGFVANLIRAFGRAGRKV